MSKNYTKEQVIEAIEKSAGIVSTIAKRLGCDWKIARKYVGKWACTQDAYDGECEKILDLAETKMIDIISQGDGPMIRYLLSTKGKRRGYTQSTEISGRDGGPIETKTNVTGIDRGFAEALALLDEARKRSDAGNPPSNNE